MISELRKSEELLREFEELDETDESDLLSKVLKICCEHNIPFHFVPLGDYGEDEIEEEDESYDA